MPQGRSIHIGLNHVDPAAYGGWAGTLKACEFDARDMCDLATSRGFQTYQLLTTQATSRALFNALDDAAAALAPGDFLFLTYSGHGGQVPDSNGDEEDGLDETWVLYDRQVIDDELYGAWAKFQPGVRIFVLSDSCHSGTVDRMMEFAQIRATQLLAMSAGAAGGSHPSTPRHRGRFCRKPAGRGSVSGVEPVRRRQGHAVRCPARVLSRSQGRAGGGRDGGAGGQQDDRRRVGDPDFGLPGQADVGRRSAQRSVHGLLPQGMGGGRLQHRYCGGGCTTAARSLPACRAGRRRIWTRRGRRTRRFSARVRCRSRGSQF